MTRQLSLFDRPHRPVEPADPNVSPEGRPRLSRQCREVLDRLREESATNAELADITHRFGGRLYDLRKAGCVIEKTFQDHRTGLVIYELKYEPEGLE